MAVNPPLPTAQPAPTQLTPFYGWQHHQIIHFMVYCGGGRVADSWRRSRLCRAVSQWRLTEPYFLSQGYHVFGLRSLSTSDDTRSLAFDFVEAFLNQPTPESIEAGFSPAVLPPTSTPQNVKRVVVLNAPPTSAPILTPLPPSVLELTLEIAYDANAN